MRGTDEKTGLREALKRLTSLEPLGGFGGDYDEIAARVNFARSALARSIEAEESEAKVRKRIADCVERTKRFWEAVEDRQQSQAETLAGDVFTRRVHGLTVLEVADLVEERVAQGVEPGANFPCEWLPFLAEGLRAAASIAMLRTCPLETLAPQEARRT